MKGGPSIVGILFRRLGVVIGIVVVLSPLVLFLFVLVWIVSTGPGIRVGIDVDIAFSRKPTTLVLFVLLFVLVGIVVRFRWFIPGGCSR